MPLYPDASGVITNILYRVGDPSALVFSSGQVAYTMFANLQDVNVRMDTMFSGTINDGYFFPEITGTFFQPILELLTAKNLVGTRLFNAANTFTMTSFREGDSVVNVADKTKALAALYKLLSEELEIAIIQTKFTLSSNSPSTVLGIDAGITEQISFRNYDTYRANQT